MSGKYSRFTIADMLFVVIGVSIATSIAIYLIHIGVLK